MTRSIEWMSQDHPLNKTNFESSSHLTTILSGLNDLRLKGLFLDITLTAGGEMFKAHRVVLASCSDYFRAMFTDAMKESRQSEICLNGVTALGMNLLLDYAYTSKLELNLANIQDVLSAASHVQLNTVVEACSTYLHSQLDIENCVDIATIAELYSLEKLRKKVYKYISSHLNELAKTNEIIRLSGFQLEYLLACDYPVDCAEAIVLKIVLQWIGTVMGNCTDDLTPNDYKLFNRLLHHVRLFEIPTVEIDKMLIAASFPAHSQIHKITSAISVTQKRGYQQRPAVTKSLQNSLINSRGMELALIKIGGFGLGGITNQITYFSPSSEKWFHLTSIPHVEQCNYGAAVFGNELFVVGGCYNVCLKEYIHPFGFRYNPMANKWTTIAPMLQDRCRFSLNFVGEFLYAIGGASEMDESDDQEIINELEVTTGERYSTKSDTWESIPSFPDYRTQHAGVALEHHLYISGGLDRYKVLATFFRFNTKYNFWEQLTPLLSPRADHVMLSIADKLYVCGGWNEVMQTENRILVSTIEMYCPKVGAWEVITTIPTPRYHSGIVAVDSKIYIIGGFFSDSMFDRATSVIECYDVFTNVWTNIEKYPQNVWECTCVALYIPRCRDDMAVMDETSGDDENT